MPTNLSALVTEAAERRPGGVAIIDPAQGTSLTWAEIEDQVAAVAAGFAQQGLVAGNRVLLTMANRAEFVISYFAALRARLVAVPFNPRSTQGELVRVLADSGARLVVADLTTIDDVRTVVPSMQGFGGAPRVVALDVAPAPGEIAYQQLEGGGGTAWPESSDARALAVLLYTSGTSSRPRAAMLSHAALIANVEQSAAVAPPILTGEDVVYGVLPLFHVYGLNAVLAQVVRQAAQMVLVDGFEPHQALGHIEQYAVTVLPVAPPVLAYWRGVEGLAGKLASVRTLLSGSAPLAPELVSEYVDRLSVTVQQGYGLTEAAPVVTSTLASEACRSGRKPASVGAPLPGIEIRLADENGLSPEPGDSGEIMVRGDNLFEGYWPDGADGPQDGWLATGDVGYIDDDGDLFLVDRLKELIIVSGFNVYPSEIEDLLLEIDGVAEVACIAVDDETTGQAVAAYVRVDQDTGVAPQEIQDLARELCDSRLAGFKRPRTVEIVDSLPRTVTGKIAKGKLRARARRHNAGLLESE